jgi:hypothetical protein
MLNNVKHLDAGSVCAAFHIEILPCSQNDMAMALLGNAVSAPSVQHRTEAS